jgi:hypothetical protein
MRAPAASSPVRCPASAAAPGARLADPPRVTAPTAGWSKLGGRRAPAHELAGRPVRRQPPATGGRRCKKKSQDFRKMLQLQNIENKLMKPTFL